MGSSTRNKGKGTGTLGLGAGGAPAMETVMQPGEHGGMAPIQAYTDASQLPAGGGWMRPVRAPGDKGTALNWTMPTPGAGTPGTTNRMRLVDLINAQRPRGPGARKGRFGNFTNDRGSGGGAGYTSSGVGGFGSQYG